jgi:hypothetical protein
LRLAVVFVAVSEVMPVHPSSLPSRELVEAIRSFGVEAAETG